MGKKPKESFSTYLFGGSLAGLLSDVCVHPFDTVRVRQQYAKHTNPYRSLMHAFTTITRTEGFTSLYKGFNIVALGTIPGHSLYFGGYEMSKRFLNSKINNDNDDNILVHLTSAFVADVFGALAWTPMDVVKQRLQVLEQKMPLGKFSKEIFKSEGITGFYRGFGAALTAFAPFVMIYFATYEQLKLQAVKRFYPSRSVLELPFYTYMGLAFTAGTVSAFATCPLDVVKTRIQTNTVSPYKNVLDAIVTITKEEGAPAFFKGLAPRIIWLAGGTALTMVFYEQIKKILR